MAQNMIATLEDVTECAAGYCTDIAYGGLVDGVDVAAEVLLISGGWGVAGGKTAAERVLGGMGAAIRSIQ